MAGDWREDLDRAYAEALAGGDPGAGELGLLLDLRRELYRRNYRQGLEILRRLPEHSGELGEALADLERGEYRPWLERGPRWLRAEAWVLKAVEAARAGRAQEAERALEQALELFPRHPRAMVNRANLWLEAGEVDRPIAEYRRALEIDPDLADAHHNLAVAYRRKGDIDRMVRHLKRSQRLRFFPPGEGGRRGGRPPLYLSLWFWLLLAAAAYALIRARG